MLQQSSGAGGQGFAAHPRVVTQKQKYKDPYGGTNAEQYFPQNIAFDKRVFRGSTNAAMVIPAGTYPDQLFQANKRKYDPKRLEQQRAKAAEEFFTRDVKTPEAPPGKQNIDIQTDQFVSELTDKAPVYEIGCQTEFKVNRPPTPHKMPRVAGVSKKTLTEDNELFLFEDEVEPILSVLCGKTLEVARMEVLQEEELAEMKRQQEAFAKMRSNEESEIKKMEEAEEKRLEAYTAKKSLEQNRREAKKIAHKKVVSRILSKNYMSQIKFNAFSGLRDVGMFRDRFDQEVLQADVMPWLYAETAKFVAEMDSHCKYPVTLIGNFVSDSKSVHNKAVADYAEKIKLRREAEQQAREDKIAEKLRRKAERAAKKKAEEIAQLKQEIKTKYVDEVKPVDEILKQEICEVDGWGQEDKHVVTALGGFLGQLMIVCNTIAKFYPQLDRPVKTGRSGGSRPKSNVSGGNRSEKSAAAQSEGATSEVPRNIINATVIQNFIYTYISEKLKSEKFAMQVDYRYEKFLNGLGNPLQLNEMRTMKADNYENLRKVLSSFLGSPVLRLIKDNMHHLDLDPDVFNLVYEGFWDLYTFHPAVRDISAKKLQVWIQKIKLSSTPDNSPPEVEPEAPEAGNESGEEEAKSPAPKGPTINTDAEDVIEPMQAIVRLKIPKIPREPERDEEGEEIPWDGNESDLDDIPFEDKCMSTVCKKENQKIWVINHLAQKTLRHDIGNEFRALNDRLDNLDSQDFSFRLEKEAAAFEELFLELLADNETNADVKTPKVPVFDFRPNKA